jgi:hypothetical protein
LAELVAEKCAGYLVGADKSRSLVLVELCPGKQRSSIQESARKKNWALRQVYVWNQPKTKKSLPGLFGRPLPCFQKRVAFFLRKLGWNVEVYNHENDFSIAKKLLDLCVSWKKFAVWANDFDYLFLVYRPPGVDVILLDLFKQSHIPAVKFKEFKELTEFQLAVVCLLNKNDNMRNHVQGYGFSKNKKQVSKKKIYCFGDLEKLQGLYGKALVQEMIQKLLQFGWPSSDFSLTPENSLSTNPESLPENLPEYELSSGKIIHFLNETRFDKGKKEMVYRRKDLRNILLGKLYFQMLISSKQVGPPQIGTQCLQEAQKGQDSYRSCTGNGRTQDPW